MADFFRDLHFAARQLKASPGFTIAAILCIALGIGANSAVFSLANSLLFRLPKVEEPERLVRMFISYASGLKFGSFSYPDYVDFRDKNDVFTGVVAEALRPLHLSVGENNEKVAGSIVSGNYFSELGVGMALGRSFLPEEDETPGTHPVAVLSHGLWQRRFGSDSNVIGRTVQINGFPYNVIGVAPRGFMGTNVAIRPDIWVPILMQEQLIPGMNLLEKRGNHWIQFTIVFHVRTAGDPGAMLEPIRREVQLLDATLPISDLKTMHGALGFALLPARLAAGVVAIFAILALLLAAVGLYGVIAYSVNQGARDIGIRMALGARSADVLSIIVRKGMTLTAAGLALGLLLGLAGTRVMGSLLYGVSPMDPTVFAIGCLGLAGVALFASILPARRAAKLDPVVVLRNE